MSPLPGNNRLVVQSVLMRTQDPGIKTIQCSGEKTETTSSATPGPSSEQPLQGSDKSSTIPSNNSPALPDNTPAGDILSSSGQDVVDVPVPGDMQEGAKKSDPRRVAAIPGASKVVNRWGKEDRSQVSCVHDDNGVCNLHGPGAREMSTPVRRKKTETRGKQTNKLEKKKWFKCDVGMKGSNLRQTTLSFGAVLEASRSGRRDNKGSLGQK